MKKMNFLLVILLAFSALVKADEKAASFLFPEYQKADVIYSNGLQSNESVNYNLIDEKLYFIDKSDNRIKIVSDIQSIAAIRLNERTFFLNDNGLRELIVSEPVELCVQYKAQHHIVNSTVGYGGTSSVASVSTYANYRAGGQQTIIKQPDVQVSAMYNCYWIGKGKVLYKFIDKKQFVKIYGKYKQKLNEYIDNKKVDFNSITQVSDLVKYAESLNSTSSTNSGKG